MTVKHRFMEPPVVMGGNSRVNREKRAKLSALAKRSYANERRKEVPKVLLGLYQKQRGTPANTPANHGR